MQRNTFKGHSCLYTLLFSLFLLCGSYSANAQQLKDLFVHMPDSLSPLLTEVNRADCIDFLESKMKAVVDNRLGGKSEMTDLSSDYLRLQLTAQTSWQMKLLPVNDSIKVICTIATACAPACDSFVRFYDLQWKEIPSYSFLLMPTTKDFFVKNDTLTVDEYDTALNKADICLIKAELNKKDNGLQFTLTTPDYLDKETAEKLKPFLRRELSFFWKEGRFNLK